jgi:transposase
MKRIGYRKFMERKKKLSGKKVVGIDPAGEKHQVALLDKDGMQIGRSFTFPVSYQGYTEKLWKELTRRLGLYDTGSLVFAVETSCALWKGIADYLTDRGYTVLLVSPLTTYYSRSLINQDFSKTDPKDALVVATNARNGSYSEYRRFDPGVNALHRLSITYEKLAKDRQRSYARLRAFMQEVFPEYLSCLGVDILSSFYLLKRYMLPREFKKLQVHEHEDPLRRISRGNHGRAVLTKIKDLAEHSVGSHTEGEEEVLRLTLDAWIAQVRHIDVSLKKITDAMITLARKTEYYEVLISLKGVSDLTASRFIAECRDLNNYDHYKQIEKLAGANVRLMDSGKYVGVRKISKIGNKRLLRLLYLMTTHVVEHVPEVRIKFLKRQLKKRCYRKNIVACIPWLLKLIMALVKEKRLYAFREESMEEMERLNKKYA